MKQEEVAAKTATNEDDEMGDLDDDGEFAALLLAEGEADLAAKETERKEARAKELDQMAAARGSVDGTDDGDDPDDDDGAQDKSLTESSMEDRPTVPK